MVRRAVSACMEDHVRGDAKFLGGTDASDRTAGHGGVGLPLLQYSRVQSEITGWSSPEGGSADRVTRRIPVAASTGAAPNSRAATDAVSASF